MNNSNINYKRALPSPEELKKEIPISKEIEEIKLKRDQEIDDVFRGKSDKLLLIIGPCSADRMDSVLEYIKRLVPIQEQVKDKILIIPRIYTGKPRTIGAGYKGMIHQPNPEKDPDMIEGIRAVREIHKRALYRQVEAYKRSIESELRNYPDDWYYDSTRTEVAATLKYERQDSIDVAFDSQLWTTYYISNAGYQAGAAGGYNYEYHRTFSKKDGSLVDSTIFNPDEKEKIVLLLRKYAEKYDARPNAIGVDFKLEPSFLKDGVGFDGSSFEIGEHTHGSVMIVVPYEEILPYMETWARREFGLTEFAQQR